MPRTGTGATPFLDRTLPDGSRFKKAIGTNDPATIKAVKAMFETLVRKRHLEILKAIQAGKLSLLDALTAFEDQSLFGLDLTDRGNLYTTVYQWLEGYTKAGTASKANMKSCFKQLEKLANSKTTVGDIPALLIRYKALCQKDGKNRAFSLAKNSCRAFLKDTLGVTSPTYLAVAEIESLDTTPERKSTPIPPKELAKLLKALPEDAADMVRFMCLTGIESNIYWSNPAKWEKVEDYAIAIHGEKLKRKSNYRDRVVPMVFQPAQPTIPLKRFRAILAKASDTIIIRDFRATFADYCNESGVIFDHVVSYMGHDRPMTLKYSTKPLRKEHLLKDAKLLKNYWETEVTSPAKKPKARFTVGGKAVSLDALRKLVKE